MKQTVKVSVMFKSGGLWPTYMYVLALAGIELVFFVVADMVQCFGFGMKTALITVMFQLLLSSAESLFEDFSASCAALAVSELEVNKELEGNISGAADPN